MSDASAISDVTRTLQSLLATPFKDPNSVVTKPLDKLGTSSGLGARLNLYLYQILPNGSWRNSPLPWKPGDDRMPLALDLRYLLTALETEDPVKAQTDLGRGMRVLHERPVLDPGGAAFKPFERARVTMHPLSLDDIEKLWIGLTGPKLLSVAYEVSVVLIESETPAKMTLPVLSRGIGRPDAIEVRAGLNGYPTIERLSIGSTSFDLWLRERGRPGRTVAQLDDDLFIFGEGFADIAEAEIVSLRFPDEKDHAHLPFKSTPEGGIKVTLDSGVSSMANIPAGLCSICLHWKRPDGFRMATNSLPFALAPSIEPLNGAPVPAGKGVTVKFRPALRPGQRVSLIVAGREFLPDTGGSANTRTFTLAGIEPDSEQSKHPDSEQSKHYPARLRVDGVDSIMIDLSATPVGTARPSFSDACKIEVLSNVAR